jgi:hypothetical protein
MREKNLNIFQEMEWASVRPPKGACLDHYAGQYYRSKALVVITRVVLAGYLIFQTSAEVWVSENIRIKEPLVPRI